MLHVRVGVVRKSGNDGRGKFIVVKDGEEQIFTSIAVLLVKNLTQGVATLPRHMRIYSCVKQYPLLM